MLMIGRLQVGRAMTEEEGTRRGVQDDAQLTRRFTAEGGVGLADRSQRPHSSPSRLDGEAEEIAALRRGRMTGTAIARRRGQPLCAVG